MNSKRAKTIQERRERTVGRENGKSKRAKRAVGKGLEVGKSRVRASSDLGRIDSLI